jgi:hypothetical protein
VIRGRGDVRYTGGARHVKRSRKRVAPRPGDGGGYQKRLPGTPLNGPATWEVIQPP